MLTQNCLQLGDHLVPKRSRKREEVKIITLERLTFHEFLERSRMSVLSSNNILTLLSDFLLLLFRLDSFYILNAFTVLLLKHILSTKILRRLQPENSQYLLLLLGITGRKCRVRKELIAIKYS